MPKPLSGIDFQGQPAADEIEYIIFGRGIGECILVHLGSGQWMVVDSCHDEAAGQAVALSYFEAIGINPATSIRLVFASHWHDDHVKGLTQILNAAPTARFIASAALTRTEFRVLAETYRGSRVDRVTGGVRELAQIYELFDSGAMASPPVRASGIQRHDVLSEHESGHGNRVEVWSLSPSYREIDLFMRRLADELAPPSLRPTKTLPDPSPNRIAVVISVVIGNESILLGGDLPETGDTDTGWSVIVESHARPQQRSSIFKLPHHGADNAHSDDVWMEMLLPRPLVTLAPYAAGRKKRPSPDDVCRILASTPDGFSTSPVQTGAVPRTRDPAVERTIKATALRRRRLTSRLGAVRARRKAGHQASKWCVKLFGAAMHLSELYE